MADLDELYRQNAKIVYHFLYKNCHDKQLAQDLTQETFLQAFESIERFDASCKISVWLCQIAKHLLYRYWEKHKRELPLETERSTAKTHTAQAGRPEKDTTWQQTATHIELLDVLKDMQKLSPTIREVMYLRITGTLSFKEIGEILGRSENWARVNFYRGKEILLKGRMKNE
ncbi:MAG: sigma-70 family RNA polymerase sigma factor [Eubacterium sp.]|nr:sigma-70 family RNA polymerase sigma factor [Eubacterium sp.]